jgi:hypothetical protein
MYPLLMETQIELRILSADRMESGLLITFNDGRSAIYSTSFLYAAFGQAEDVSSQPEDEE